MAVQRTESGSPKISMVVPWANRTEICETLPANIKKLKGALAQVVIVNCGGDPRLLQPALDRAADLGVPLTVVELKEHRFNKSLALNLGASVSVEERLFFMDADVILERYIVPAKLNNQFITIDRVRESIPGILQESKLASYKNMIYFETCNGVRLTLETNHYCFQKGTKSGPGLVLTGRKAFLNINGMNSRLEGWGWEDMDYLVRLQLNGGLKRVKSGSAVHLTHGDDVRDVIGASRFESEDMNFRMCMANYHRGCFVGTYSDDLEEWGGRVNVLHSPS